MVVAFKLLSKSSTSDSQSLLLLLESPLPSDAPQGHSRPPQPLKHKDKYVERDASCSSGNSGKNAIKSSVEFDVRLLAMLIVSWLRTKHPRESLDTTRVCSAHRDGGSHWTSICTRDEARHAMQTRG